MTAEKDPRIEAVAKLLFTGPIYAGRPEDWDEMPEHDYIKRQCLMAAEDVLRGIDEAAGIAGPWTAMNRVAYICGVCGEVTDTENMHDHFSNTEPLL